MKRSVLKLPVIACSFLLLSACGDGEKSADRTEEIYEKHVDHEDMTESQHETIAEPEEIPRYDEVPAALQSQVNSLLDHYLEIKNALVENSTEEARIAAGQMLGKIKNFAGSDLPEEQKNFYEARIEEMSDDLRFMAQNNALDKHRDHFSVVTKNTYALAKALNTENTLYYQYCPMAFNNNGGYWLSAQEEIRNPYFGDKMLECGRIEETIAH